MNINLIFPLLIVNDYLCYLCEGCMSSKLTIFFSANLFQHSTGKGSTERSLTGISSLT